MSLGRGGGAMNRHFRRQQHAKQRRSDGVDEGRVWQAGLEAQARNFGFPSVESMAKAYLLEVRALVRRLPDDPTLSIGDCLRICIAACATAGGGRVFVAEFVVMLDPFIRRSRRRRPDEQETAAILAKVRTYLEAVEMHGTWSMKGVEKLRLNEVDDLDDVKMSAAALSPSVAVPPEDSCWICKRPLIGSMVAVVPYDDAPPGWTSVQVHASCVPLLRGQSGEPS